MVVRLSSDSLFASSLEEDRHSICIKDHPSSLETIRQDTTGDYETASALTEGTGNRLRGRPISNHGDSITLGL